MKNVGAKKGAPQARLPYDTNGLSEVERARLRSLPSGTAVSLLVVQSDGAVSVHASTAAEALSTQESILELQPGAAVVLDSMVELLPFSKSSTDDAPRSAARAAERRLALRTPVGRADDMGLSLWHKQFPLADGRGVRVAIVGDGIALNELGLEKNSTGKPSVAAAFQMDRQWQLPLRQKIPDCSPRITLASQLTPHWRYKSGLLPFPPASATKRVSFDLTPCGINHEIPFALRCEAWEEFRVPESGGREAVLRLPALYLEYPPVESGKKVRRFLAVDLDRNGNIGRNEITRDVGYRGSRGSSTEGENGIEIGSRSKLGFDVHPTAELFPPKSLYSTSIPCSGLKPAQETLSLVLPKRLNRSEGKHSTETALRIAGAETGENYIEGFAKGTEFVDVHLGDPRGAQPYSIGQIGRALLVAGNQADIVHFGYALAFHSPASLVAMGRFLDALLGNTKALYVFGAGDEGPGRGTSNNSLLIPRAGLSVAAFTKPVMRSVSYDNSPPERDVVWKSSRGPGLDGGRGPHLTAPLDTVPFEQESVAWGSREWEVSTNGSSSFAAFAALLLSRIRNEGLAYDRDVFKEAILSSAIPLKGVPFVDQGFGVPHLLPALARYRALLASEETSPPLVIDGGLGERGVVRRGIWVRDSRQRQDEYGFTVSLGSAGTSGVNRRSDFDDEELILESEADWLAFPSALKLSRGNAEMTVRVHFDRLDLVTPEFLTHITFKNAATGLVRGVLPVTIASPREARDEISGDVVMSPTKVHRIFLVKPTWATHLLVSREVDARDDKLCGRTAVYNPVSTRAQIAQGPEGSWTTETQVESVHEARSSGVYEITFQGHFSDYLLDCPQARKQKFRARWMHIAVSPESLRELPRNRAVEPGKSFRLKLTASTEVTRGLSGTLLLQELAHHQNITLLRGEAPFQWDGQGGSFDFDTMSVALAPVDGASLPGLRGAPYFRLSAVAGYYRQSEPGLEIAQITGADFSSKLDLSALGLRDGNSIAGFAPRITAFESGMDDASTIFGSMKLLVRGWRKDDLGTPSLALPVRDMRPGGIQVLSADFVVDDDLDELRKKSFECRFRPEGYRVSVPCGSVPLE